MNKPTRNAKSGIVIAILELHGQFIIFFHSNLSSYSLFHCKTFTENKWSLKPNLTGAMATALSGHVPTQTMPTPSRGHGTQSIKTALKLH
jgi:hypothetical protein